MSEDRLLAIENELRNLRDRQAIRDLVVSSSRGNDRCDVDLITGSYHSDGLHELGKQNIPGPDYAEHANHAHAAISELSLHNVTMQSCEIDGDVAHTESYVIGLFADKGAAMSRILAGRYIDRLEKRDGAWRIVLRRATVEVALEGKAILPNGNGVLGSGYLRGSRSEADPSYQRPLTVEGGERW